ncbi:MAG TPA: SemiSWEET transporter [Flavobacterium sp.]|jgi:MtN3 and saliva related transmembrane protein
MDEVQLLGLAAAVFTTAANIPQTYKMIKTKSTKSISTVTYAMLLTGFLVWIAYGIFRDDLPIIIANGISALISSTILFLKHSSKEVLDNLHEKLSPDSDSK